MQGGSIPRADVILLRHLEDGTRPSRMSMKPAPKRISATLNPSKSFTTVSEGTPPSDIDHPLNSPKPHNPFSNATKRG